LQDKLYTEKSGTSRGLLATIQFSRSEGTRPHIAGDHSERVALRDSTALYLYQPTPLLSIPHSLGRSLT